MIHTKATEAYPHIPVVALGWSVSLFLAITYTVCVLFGLIFPSVTMYQLWLPLLPGVSWISLPRYFLGLIETFAYGWFVALVFAPLFNQFAKGFAK